MECHSVLEWLNIKSIYSLQVCAFHLIVFMQLCLSSFGPVTRRNFPLFVAKKIATSTARSWCFYDSYE